MSLHVDASQVRALGRKMQRSADQVNAKTSVLVRKTGFSIEADGKLLAAVDTGTMRNSVSTSISAGGLTAEIGPTVDYAVYVENGTSRMRAQPFMAPAFDRRRPAFEAAIAKLAAGGI